MIFQYQYIDDGNRSWKRTVNFFIFREEDGIGILDRSRGYGKVYRGQGGWQGGGGGVGG